MKTIVITMSHITKWVVGVLVFLLFGCEEQMDESDKALLRFMNDSEQVDYVRYPSADSLFNYSVPICPNSKLILVFVVDGSCSICIAQALHCFQHFMKIRREEESFCFIIADNQSELFSYYCEKAGVAGVAVIYPVESISRWDQGLYVVRNNRVMNYRKWNRI